VKISELDSPVPPVGLSETPVLGSGTADAVGEIGGTGCDQSVLPGRTTVSETVRKAVEIAYLEEFGSRGDGPG
jgi:hypothetical protein